MSNRQTTVIFSTFYQLLIISVCYIAFGQMNMSNVLLTRNLQPRIMLDNVTNFTEKLLGLADDIGIDITELEADHIALRINDEFVAKEAHHQWLKYGEQISSAVINGRPIIVICFENPLQTDHWLIECLELPYPAEGKTYPQEGWEHMEFVVSSEQTSAEGYLDDLKKRFPRFNQQWQLLQENQIKTKLSSPKGEGERLANPTIAFKRDGVCIKIHPHSLKTVVKSEQNAG